MPNPQLTPAFETAARLCIDILTFERNGSRPTPEEARLFFLERFPDLYQANQPALFEIGLEAEIREYCREHGIEFIDDESEAA